MTQKRKAYLLTAAVLALAFTVSIAMAGTPPKPASLTFACEDTNSFPWVFQNKGNTEGLDIELLKILERRLGVKINLVKYPWKRCLAMMKSGEIDGVIGSSFKPDRLNMGSYPTKQGGSNESTRERDVDISKRLHISGYSLYRLKGTPIEWNGKTFKNLGDKTIAAQMDFTIAVDLLKLGAVIKETPEDPSFIFRGLINGHFAAAALQTSTANHILNRNSEYRSRIEKCSVDVSPFHQKPYYLMLSFQLMSKYPGFAEKIWKGIEEVRESDAYKNKSRSFLKNY
jgi:polar amino acid transport system substrate-binding protein